MGPNIAKNRIIPIIISNIKWYVYKVWPNISICKNEYNDKSYKFSIDGKILIFALFKKSIIT